MTLLYTLAGAILLATLASFFFSVLTYSLRDYSRAKLEDYLSEAGLDRYLDPTVDHTDDLIFLTAVLRLFSNLGVLLAFQRLVHDTEPLWLQYLLALLCAGSVTLLFSVALPHAVARYAAERLIAISVRPLHVLRVVFTPIIKIGQATDLLVRRASGANGQAEPEEIEQEIIAVVEEGEKEGVVDEREREMIKSVLEFNNLQVGEIMTARPEIVALEYTATLQQVKQVVEESGHSRIPVYRESLDQIVGILYARELLRYVGVPPEQFDISKVIRPPYYVPETKPLRDLLQDFRLQKVHMAIVLDEYGGTAGLVTIEDLLEEVVGDISDEHEPIEPAMFKRIDDQTAEVDARIYIDEVNRLMGLDLPEDEGYSTLGGFVSTTLGRIPEPGATFSHDSALFTVLDAEPQKVNRVRIELQLQPAASDGADSASE